MLLAGPARAGPLAFPVPAVGSPRGPRSPDGLAFDFTISSTPAGSPGRRRLTLGTGTERLELDYPILAPEVSGAPGALVEAAPRAWVVHAPLAAEDRARLAQARPELIVLANARALFGEGEPFVEALREIRESAGARPLLWAPRVALPHRLALLGYLGVDLVDTTDALWRGQEGMFLDATLGVAPVAEAPRSCRCPACREGSASVGPEHALYAMLEERERVRAVVRAGRLRELVEARLTAEPLLAELLRYADRHLRTLLEERLPVVSTVARGYVLHESHRRPEVGRFRARLLERYRPPSAKRCLLVVPCSKTKPYRSSRSHRRFQRALEGIPNLEQVHTVSVTSPLGAVPRELEDTFPARHYDIPVTGEWDESEREAVRSALGHLLSLGRYEHAVVHLDPIEYGFLADLFESTPGVTWTAPDHRTTSGPALAALRAAVEGAVGGGPSTPGGPLAVVREELAQVAAVQFGVAAAQLLFAPPVRLAGRPWFQRVTDGSGTDLATWREPRGLFQLTVAGGRRMLPAHPLEVRLDSNVRVAGDLFAPGVEAADPAIRVGDAVLLIQQGELFGVGEAMLPGRLMTELGRGIAVHVRHRSHPEAPDRAPTPT